MAPSPECNSGRLAALITTASAIAMNKRSLQFPSTSNLKKTGVPLLTLDESESKDTYSRVFVYQQAFYSIFQKRRQQFVFGERPSDLAQADTIDQRILEKHQAYLRRLENFPLKKAAYYHKLREDTGIKSVRGLSEITGEDWSYIARVLKTLELPAPIQDFLNTHKEQAMLKHFHLRRLLELIRSKNESQLFSRFREMLDEIGSPLVSVTAA